jgi:hypothetical protein
MSLEVIKNKSGYVTLSQAEQSKLRRLIFELGERPLARHFGGVSSFTVIRAAAGCELVPANSIVLRSRLAEL